MDIEIIERHQNPSLHREEVRFRVLHENEPTPSRDTVAAKLAAIVNADRDRTVIREVKSEFGLAASLGLANVYESTDFIRTEPKHILKRNGLIEEDA